jgi:hypothetical protein
MKDENEKISQLKNQLSDAAKELPELIGNKEDNQLLGYDLKEIIDFCVLTIAMHSSKSFENEAELKKMSYRLTIELAHNIRRSGLENVLDQKLQNYADDLGGDLYF